MNSKVIPKNRYEICAEWDTICRKRHTTIEQGKDISLTYVTAPCILKHISEESPKNVIDVGCGSGYLANKIAENVTSCCGIDLSRESILLARKKYSRNNLHFTNCAISEFVSETKFDACISNMVFMTDPEWLHSIKNIYNILLTRGTLFIMITHPCFWPKYWGYQDESWFNYNDEIYIESDFNISLVKSIGKTTHIHRPLSQYFSALISAGFIIERIEEPYPTAQIPHEYIYSYPRFLFIKCRKLYFL